MAIRRGTIEVTLNALVDPRSAPPAWWTSSAKEWAEYADYAAQNGVDPYAFADVMQTLASEEQVTGKARTDKERAALAVAQMKAVAPPSAGGTSWSTGTKVAAGAGVVGGLFMLWKLFGR